MAGLPQAADIAKVLPAALAEAGGSFTLAGLQQKLSQNSKFKIAGMSSERQVAYLSRTFQDAVTILIRSKAVEEKGERIHLTDKGWAQAESLGVKRPNGTDLAQAIEPPEVTIDVTYALALVEMKRRDGTWIRGHLRMDAPKFQGRAFEGHFSELLDDLYSAEVDGHKTAEGFYAALREDGVSASARELLETKCRVRLIGLVPERRAARSNVIAHVGKGGRPGRRKGITWERLVCEVMGELGGHAEWAAIAEAAGRKPAVVEYLSWREECRQALRNNTAPAGRSYFEIAEVGSGSVYTLTEQGRKMAARRTEDDRAPTLSKLLAKALDPGEGASLTDHELWALFHLAVELGSPPKREASTIGCQRTFPTRTATTLLDTSSNGPRS